MTDPNDDPMRTRWLVRWQTWAVVLVLTVGLMIVGIQMWPRPPSPDRSLAEPQFDWEFSDCVDLYEWGLLGWELTASAPFEDALEGTWHEPHRGSSRACRAPLITGTIRLPADSRGLYRVCHSFGRECIVVDVDVP